MGKELWVRSSELGVRLGIKSYGLVLGLGVYV